MAQYYYFYWKNQSAPGRAIVRRLHKKPQRYCIIIFINANEHVLFMS